MTATVRRLRSDEWAAWRSLRLRALEDAPDAFENTLQRESALSEAIWRERTVALAGSADRAMFVAEQRGELVGCSGIFCDPAGAPNVISVWVAPEARRRGLAGALLHACTEFCRAAGKPAVRLHVAEGNEAAGSLYRRHGFVETGRTATLNRDPPVVEREMELRLA